MPHVVTLETARKLKEVGIEFPNSEFWYEEDGILCYRTEVNARFIDSPAPILTELLERLPAIIKVDGITGQLDFWKHESGAWHIQYLANEKYRLELFASLNPCEAAAQLLLTLKEKGLLNE